MNFGNCESADAIGICSWGEPSADALYGPGGRENKILRVMESPEVKYRECSENLGRCELEAREFALVCQNHQFHIEARE